MQKLVDRICSELEKNAFETKQRRVATKEYLVWINPRESHALTRREASVCLNQQCGFFYLWEEYGGIWDEREDTAPMLVAIIRQKRLSDAAVGDLLMLILVLLVCHVIVLNFDAVV